ncbi:MAG: deoxyuridine 5'-triphosphate nucleotidohydrolase [Candidatus Njordarchaeia archaeon]
MLLSGEEIAKIIANIDQNQIQPSGLDLRVDEIQYLRGKGLLLKNRRELPKYETLALENGKWFLQPGVYIVRYVETIVIPKHAAGIVLPRSSLLRMGATIYTALWDPGYKGKGISLLHVFNPDGLEIERYARIAQLILISAKSSGTYAGKYQYEGLDK